ncbi:hypothetical protein DWB85_19265 [Seongchinamella sediminis]|uniref:Uncharacterized protein n=1 Tax=Seongchinamella sediminis TaxID=2283635 RepID=A0A3L7DTQ0_9GAMM|nr:hypothetical protein [Seongchinamella sediminis]RLQ20145.1 hypothetical protein DWB85_19265 [Seongchinamella sediminis]
MNATTTLKNGDTAGPMFDIKRAMDTGMIVGPRVYPSGPAISQTSGHMDFRTTWNVPSTPDTLHPFERMDQF